MSNRAVAVIKGDKESGVHGVIWFTQEKEGQPTKIKGEIKG
uniref:Uncharacterized protein n=1 Tax=Plectus sambesii TaxID=2011161 RepID=A0A914VZW8_9BILA